MNRKKYNYFVHNNVGITIVCSKNLQTTYDTALSYILMVS